jgi:hypothetical protein
MKIFFLISVLLAVVLTNSVKAAILVDKTMFAYNKTFNLNYCLPNDFDEAKVYPLIVAMHYCGGTSKEYRSNLTALCDSLKMIVVCPDNKSNVIYEGEQSILVTAIDSSRIFFPIDTTKVYLTGMSCNGEFITRYGLNNFYPFKGIFPWDPWIQNTNPKAYNFNSKMPIVISVGYFDPNYKTLISFYDSLKAHQATVNLVIIPNVAHELFNGFSNEMIKCIYYLNGTPDFSFDPISNSEVFNTDSALIDIHINNPGDKKLKFSAGADMIYFVSKTEILPGIDKNHFKVKVVPAKKKKGKMIITVTAFDEVKKEMSQVLVRMEIKEKPAAMEKIQQNGFSVYPVPVNDYLYFSCNDQHLSIQISDVSGKEMINLENVDTSDGIQLQSLPNGFYFLHARGKNTNETIKFLKN